MNLKLSNIQGIDYIPSHWQVKELKYCLLPGSEGIKIGPFGSALKSEMLVEEGYKVYGQENLIKDDFSLGHRFISEEKFNELNVYEIAKNDVLISMMGTVGKCKVVPSDIQKGIMDSHLIRIRFNENLILPEFAAYLIQDSYYIKMQIDLNSKGSIMSGLNSSIIKNLKLLLPPVSEQRVILQYLEMKNEVLNHIQKSKLTLLDLLNKQRQSIITEAVTKGLNPNVKMKDSGVEWIGEIPEHWEKKKMKYVGQAVTGLTYSPEDLTDENGTIVLRSTNIQKGKISLHDNVYVDKEIPNKLLTKKNDILICSRNGSRHLIGKNALIESEINLSFGAFTTVFRSENNDFIYFVLNSNFFEAQLGTYLTSTINQLTIGNLNNMDIVLPPREEQIDIVNYLRKITENYNEVLNKIEIQIEKLKEYRQSLIYEAVTGKIDIRDMELD